MNVRAAGYRLMFGDLRTSGIEFGPITPPRSEPPPHDVFDCPVSATVDGEPVEFGERQGMEGYALANLRSNLRQMIAVGRGTFWFGDHDFGMFVEVTRQADSDMAGLTLDLPSADRWDIPLPPLSTEEMGRPIATIDAIEADFGPLTGACGACGVNEPMFHSEPYRFGG